MCALAQEAVDAAAAAGATISAQAYAAAHAAMLADPSQTQ